MAEPVPELMSAPATSGDELAAGAPPPPAHAPLSSLPQTSPAAAPSSDDKAAKKAAKKKRDAERAAVRRRLEDLESAGSVEELEAKLLGRIKPAAAASSPASNVVPIAGAVAVAAATGAAAPGAPKPPTPEQIRAWREATEKVLGGFNELAKLSLPAPYPLAQEELEQLYKAAPPVLAKYLPEVFVSPELLLLGVVVAIAAPRVMFGLKLGPYAEQQSGSAEAAPTGKAAA